MRPRNRSSASHDRLWAASLLRKARSSDDSSASEYLDWALFVAPQSRPIERARIRMFIREGNLDAAESLIARALLQRPDDVLLRILRATCMELRGRYTAARADVQQVLATNPHRCDALRLGARIASALGEHDYAVACLQRAVERRPCDDRTIVQLSAALLETGRLDDAHEAEHLLTLIGHPAPDLFAGVLLAQGRVLDAVEHLESHLNAPEAIDDRDTLLAQYITTLERAGRVGRLLELLDVVHPHDQPQAANALARAMLALGRFRAAIVLTLRALRTGRTDHPQPAALHDRLAALSILFIAATFANRPRFADRAMLQVHAIRSGLDMPDWIDAWRRGMRGLLLHDQRAAPPRATAIGCDPTSSILQPMLRKSVEDLRQQIAEYPVESRELDQDLIICRSALSALSAPLAN